MHELSLATEIVDIALEAAGKADATDVTAVHITMDPASHLDRTVLADAFEMAATGTPADGATLEVIVESGDGGEVAVVAIETSETGN